MAQAPSPDCQIPQELKLSGIQVVTQDGKPKVIGRGSYATVIELSFHGLKCAGKKFHEILYHETAEPLAREAIERAIIRECETLTGLRHPHIVQFLGTYCTVSDSPPIIVMEFLPTTLTNCIEKYESSLPDEISYTILEDAACALSYLHSKHIAHRDLSTSNILLTLDLRAKISDLGEAKDLSSTPRDKMSKQPGTPCFMPPEALRENPLYGSEIDIFSFGVVVLAVFCGEYPGSLIDAYHKDVPESENYQRLSEIARRQKYIDRIVPDHAMLSLIRKCLDVPRERPTANEAQQKISQEKLKLAMSDKSKIDILKEKIECERKIHALDIKQLTMNTEIGDLKERIEQLEDERREYEMTADIGELRQANEVLQKTIDRYRLKEANETKKVSRDHRKVHELKVQRNRAMNYLTSGDKLHLLHDQVKLSVKKLVEAHTHGEEKPVELHAPMTAVQCTLIRSTLYFGGGETSSEKNAERNQLFAFNSTDNTIERLPRCPAIHFGLGNIGGKLVVVGGRSVDGKSLSSSVYVLKGLGLDGKTPLSGGAEPHILDAWDELPFLSVARARVCVISQTDDESSTCIAACGGRVFDEAQRMEVSTSVVEVYQSDSENHQWVTVTRLPEPRAALRATVLHSTVYLTGGYQDMGDSAKPDCFSIPLCNLFNTDKRIAWTSMKPLPIQSATPAHLCGTLLAIGGSTADRKPIHAYNPNKRQWVHIADLAVGLAHASAAALPKGRVMIIGGRDNTGSRNKNLFIVEVTGRML